MSRPFIQARSAESRRGHVARGEERAAEEAARAIIERSGFVIVRPSITHQPPEAAETCCAGLCVASECLCDPQTCSEGDQS